MLDARLKALCKTRESAFSLPVRVCQWVTLDWQELMRLTALGSERFPQYAGEHMGFLILERVLTVTESFVSGYRSQSVFLARTTCFHKKAQTASVMLGTCPALVDNFCLKRFRLFSEMK